MTLLVSSGASAASSAGSLVACRLGALWPLLQDRAMLLLLLLGPVRVEMGDPAGQQMNKKTFPSASAVVQAAQ